MPSFILIHPTVWPQYTNVIDRTGQDRETGQRFDSIGRTVLQTVAQNQTVCVLLPSYPFNVKATVCKICSPNSCSLREGHALKFCTSGRHIMQSGVASHSITVQWVVQHAIRDRQLVSGAPRHQTGSPLRFSSHRKRRDATQRNAQHSVKHNTIRHDTKYLQCAKKLTGKVK